MDHRDHVALIADGVAGREDGVWADLGSGTGAFTLALADLLEPGGHIVSVDRDRDALVEQERRVRDRFPAASVEYRTADFTDSLALPALDGLVIANSLHFVRDKEPVLRRLVAALRPGGRFVLVEYDADAGNPYVPYPLSYRTWERLAPNVGLTTTQLLGLVPSRFLGAIYSAVSSSAG